MPGKISILREGNDLAVFVTGEILYQVMEAAQRLHTYGIETEVVSVHTLKPIDAEGILEIAGRHPMIYSVEEHSIIGGLGAMIAEILATNACGNRLKRIGLEDCFAKGYGTQQQVLEANKLDAGNIYQRIVKDFR